MLKIEPFERYIVANQPCTVYVGIRADETEREGVAWEQSGDVVRRYPFVEWNWGLGDVVGYLEKRGIVIPERTDCGACFFQTLWEWYRLYTRYPDRYERYCEWEDLTGHTLRSEQRDTWPAGLRALAAEFESGRIPKQRKAMKDRAVMCSVCAR